MEKNPIHLKIGFALVAICAAGMLLYLGTILHSAVYESVIPFDTDEADHANPSLNVYNALLSGDPLKLYSATVKQAFYPPLYSFVVAISYAVFTPSFYSSRLPAVICYLTYILLMFLVTKKFLQKDETLSAWPAAVFAALVAASSPITLNNSVLCMLEVPGVLAVTLCIFYFVYTKASGNLSALLIPVLLGLAVFFTKYNFGIITVPAVLAAIFFDKGFKAALKAGIFAAAIVGLWALATDLPQFIHFFKGHKSYAPLLSGENLFFELRAWINSYCAHPAVAAGVLLLAVLGAVSKYKEISIKFALFNTLFSFLVLALSTTNEERHFMVALPGIIFLAAIGLNGLTSKFALDIRCLSACAASVLVIFCFSLRVPNFEAELNSQFEGEAYYKEIFDFIYSQSAEPLLIYGLSDDLSIEALRWYFSVKSENPYREIMIDAYPYRDDKNFTARMRNRNLDWPYREKTFPKKPIERIIERRHYRSFVHILNKDRKQRFFKEGEAFKAALESGLKAGLNLGNREVKVYSAPEP